MKVAVISANLGPGGYDREWPWAEQNVPDGVEIEIHRLNDSNFPPRSKAMTPALQVGIVKWCAEELFPGFDRYLWLDASVALTRGNEIHLWLEILGSQDIALFKHPERRDITEEFEFIEFKIGQGNKYLLSRYEGEWLRPQYEYIQNKGREHARLYASTAFMWRPCQPLRVVFKEVLFQKYRYHLHDQLALAYALAESTATIQVINQNYQKSGLIEFVRNKKQ